MKFIPHDYQKFSIEFLIEHPKAGLLLDMGLGKTASVLAALDKLSNFYLEIDKVLIVAPKRVAVNTWPDEIKKWDDFQDMHYSVIVGTEKQRVAALRQKAFIYLINRENIVWLYAYLKSCNRLRLFDTIVIDESSSFKTANTNRFKALKKMTAKCPRVIILTGTPVPNGLMDLWSQMYLLDRGKRLGGTLTEYRRRYFDPGRCKGRVVFDWNPKENAEEDIYRAIAGICVSMKTADYLKMPERIDNVIKIKMSAVVKGLYKRFKRDFLIEVRNQVITAATAGVLCNKLLQLSNGALYKDDGSYEVIHQLKLEALEEILENNPEVPILVFYNFKSDFIRLKEYFRKYSPKTLDSPNALMDWNNRKIRLLLANPASMGYGLNMQAGD